MAERRHPRVVNVDEVEGRSVTKGSRFGGTMSTLLATEVVGYPDSGKIGLIAAESIERSARGDVWLRLVTREGDALDYYDGEDIG